MTTSRTAELATDLLLRHSFAAAIALFAPRLTVPNAYVFDEVYHAYTAGQYAAGNHDAYLLGHFAPRARASATCGTTPRRNPAAWLPASRSSVTTRSGGGSGPRFSAPQESCSRTCSLWRSRGGRRSPSPPRLCSWPTGSTSFSRASGCSTFTGRYSCSARSTRFTAT